MTSSLVRPLALLVAVSCAACPQPTPTNDADTDATSVTDASDALVDTVTSDVPTDAYDPRTPLAYMPENCTYMVRTTAGTVFNSMGDTSTFGASPEPQRVHVTWASAPSTTAAVLWATDAATIATVVQYGTSMATLDHTALGHVTSAGAAATNAHMHETHLCGLMPDTTYYYRVGGEGHWSAIQHFRTAPAAGSSNYDVNFAVAGDTRDSFPTWSMVQSQMLAMSGASAPDFLMFSGDAIPFGTDQGSWNQWFDASSATMGTMPYVFAHGNHEALSLNYLVQIAQPQSGEAERDELYFSFEYGPIHFVVLNDSPAGDAAAVITGSERTWLASDLAAVDRVRTPWVVALHHKGAFSSSNHTSDLDVTRVRAAWPPVFSQYHVDMVFNGHDHNFEVTHPLAGDGTVATDPTMGTTYYTAAGGGAMLYASATSAWTLHSESVMNFLLVHATEHTLEVTPYRLDGTIITAGHITLSR